MIMAQNCILCTEPIETLQVVRINPGWAHRECGIRSAVGGIGHIEDHSYWCENVGDPDGGRSYRQSAIEVCKLWDAGAIHAEEADGL